MTARDFALLELDARELPHWPRRPRARKFASATLTDPRDLALAENIVIGVIKNLLLLQHLIQHYSERNLKSIDPIVQKILAIALYQLRFLTRVPASAAVDEAVEQAKRFGQARAAGFVNAVLRKATREPSPPLPGRQLPADYARIVLSHPPELYSQLQKLLGPDDALRFCEHDQEEPPTLVRIGIGVDPAALAGENIAVTPHEQAGIFVVAGAKRSLLADWSERGIAQVQDATAADVVRHLNVEPGQVVLDRCCGLGTKTLQMRDAVGADGRVVAMDPAEARCMGLKQLLGRRNIGNVEVHCAGWLRDIRGDVIREFDRVLADVPCSNSGVLARRPEARYAQTPQALRSLAKLQDEILNDTASVVKRQGGLLIYSTCSIWPEENRQRVDAFLKRHGDFELVEEKSTLPTFDSDPTRYRDGGYLAVLARK